MASNLSTTEDSASRPPSFSPQYRLLDRTKDEFRLLKILPPIDLKKQSSDPMTLSCETVKCELQYESLSEMGGIRELLDGCIDRNHALNMFSKKIDIENDILGPFRKNKTKALLKIYKQSRRILKYWGSEQFKFQERPFKDWSRTWIWEPLNDDIVYFTPDPLAYFALSYPWTDKIPPYFGQEKYKGVGAVATASGITMREILEKMEEDPEGIDEICGKSSDSLEEYACIIVDGNPVLVGKNLELALRTLREVPDIHQGTMIWVDALCINQKDIDEKNFEATRIGKIYRKADRVISYLGEEMVHSGSVLEYMDEISKLMDPKQKSLLTSLPKKVRMVKMLSNSIAKLFSRPYFNRIWVIQEVVLGGDRSILICGKRQFLWKSLMQCGVVLESGIFSEMGDETKEAIKKFLILRSAKLEFECNGKRQKMFLANNSPWLRIPNTNQSRDSRDSIYGIMYLLPKALSSSINVNYASHNRFADVMRTFAETYIKCTNSLLWILHRNYMIFMNDQNWPTWVPNLAQKFSLAHVKWIENTEDSACPKIPSYFEFGTKDRKGRHLLICKGVRLDVILLATVPVIKDTLARTLEVIKRLETSRATAYAARNNTMTHTPSLEREKIDSLKQFSTKCAETDGSESVQHPSSGQEVPLADSHQYCNMEGLERALRSCCTRANIELPDKDNTFLYYGFTFEYIPPDQNGSDGLSDPRPSFELRDTRDSALFTDEEQDEENLIDQSLIEKDFLRLFTTRSGYVGATLGKIRIGDEIWLIAGCRMPVVLRRNCEADDSYALIGAVYIPGLMNGEGLKIVRMRNGKFRKIRIA
ncbi:hypothetical protein EYC80_007700 [Monilinia laxa]|uniref:Heterokaryon incompatibility domain-containing protein n=1 Tax=Monilinia laxa TaxID=61186 RepID=A0A5N6JX49_MONLA|nr:hypothetical protein EYC80_007700 [Monilinia laxa]